MNQRRKLTKDERMAVYEKTNGHCAYCGCELEYKDMQVDHVIPINGWSEQGEDTLDNIIVIAVMPKVESWILVRIEVAMA